MRLLLLLSAFLTALSGAIGPRAAGARPVVASAAASGVRAERVAAVFVTAAPVRPARAAAGPPTPPDLIAPARPFPLYADRLRE